jgi:hypothetical protein
MAAYFAGTLLTTRDWTTLLWILVAYHVILVWRVITAEHKTGLSLPIGSTIVTHLACLAVVVGIGLGRHYVPILGFVRYLIPGIAPFECKWLFSAETQKKEKPKPVLAPAAATAAAEVAAVKEAVTGDDYEVWLQHIAHRKPAPRKPGTTVKDEYDQFMVARAKQRSAAAPASPQP